MGNILFLTHRLPYPPNKGDKVRSYHLLKHLAARHRVFLGTFVDDPADLAYVDIVRADCEDMHVATLSPTSAKVRALAGIFSGEPLTLPYYRDQGLDAWVAGVSKQCHIDATVIFSSAMAQYVDGRSVGRVVVDFVDVDSAKWSEYAKRHAWPMSWLYRREGVHLLEFERRTAASAVRSIFVTAKESDLFRSLAPESADRIGFVCNGVDAEFFSPAVDVASPFAADEIPIVFTGAMDYWPNADAVIWFAAEVLPRLRARWPTLRFHVVGRSPTAEVQALASDAIRVTGTVPDVRPYLRHAALVVAPLRLARGIQNKILEAMAMARAVVAADSCAGALDAMAGRDLEVAATPQDYEHAINALLEDPARAATMGIAARERVLAHYSWDAHLAGFDRFLEPAGAPQAALAQAA